MITDNKNSRRSANHKAMQLINIQRLERMHSLILRKATGTPDEFAQTLGISKSMLMINLNQLKQKGGPIEYNSLGQTYYYTKPCRFFFGYELEKESLGKIKGGKVFPGISLIDKTLNFSDLF